MTAIVLAAGVGRRMGPGSGPKCLLSVGGKSLLQRLLESLRAVGVKEVVLVTGFASEEVEGEARAHAGGVSLHLVENERFREGAILSLWTAREFLDRPVLVMDADVLAPPPALERLVGSAHANCLLVDAAACETGEEMMVFGEGARVLQITKQPSEEMRKHLACFGESVGFLKLSADGAHALRGFVVAKVQAGEVGLEHEQAYPDLFRAAEVGCERMDGLPWTEIDTPADLKRAREEVYPAWVPPACFNRSLAGLLLPWVLRLELTPNQWTFVGLILGLGAAAAAAAGTVAADLAAAGLFQMFYLTDVWDGEVARARSLSSRWGGWFDVSVDMVVHLALMAGMTAGLMRAGAPPWVGGVGLVAALGVALDFLVTLWAKWRGFGPAIYGDPSAQRRLPAGQAGVAAHPLAPASHAAARRSPAPLPEDSQNTTGAIGDARIDKQRCGAVLRWFRLQWTNENFSLIIAAVLVLRWKLAFLLAAAVGTHAFWVRYLWKGRGYSFAQARR